MAITRFGLCFILTVWMAGTRPSAFEGNESPHSSPWWEAEEFASIERASPALRAAADWAALESLYQRGYQEAWRRGIIGAQVAYLGALGNVRVLQARYAEALQAYLEGKTLAEAAGAWNQVALIALNLVGLYEQVWDYDSALGAAEEGIRAIRRQADAAGEFRAQLLLQLGRLYSARQDRRAEGLLHEGIEAARAQGDAALEALGLDILGELLQSLERLEDADRALTEAFRLRALHAPGELRLSYGRLASLKLAQFRANRDENQRVRELDQALALAGKGLRANRARPASRSSYLLHHLVGEILREQGQSEAALKQFRTAVVLAARWRTTLPATASALTGSNSELDRRVFDAFVDTAAEHASAAGDRRWLVEAFLASEANRAVSLRETRALAEVWRRKLPAEYWQILTGLRNEDSRLMQRGEASSALANRLRLRLSELEASVNLGFFSRIPENFLHRSSLIHFQHGLSESELFLSFRLGEPESTLWTVTKAGIRLYRIEPESALRPEIERFREAVIEGKQEAASHGERLYQRLFGRLGPEETNKESWLLSVEGSLYRLPFAALVPERAQGKVGYLVERHSVQLVPGAFSLWNADAGPAKTGRRVLVGDPIYNLADPRLPRRTWGLFRFPRGGDESAVQLNRLPGSGREIEAAARSAPPAQFTILQGSSATAPKFVEAASVGADAIHLATHVLTTGNGKGQAFIAFGVGKNERPEMLATSDVAMLHVPGSLVVMTGCATGAGDLIEGGGLLGLTRAWMLAGARNVLATSWDVRDRGVHLIPAFYRHWERGYTAEALRRSQLAMIASGGAPASPAYWAAYQLIGGGR